MVGGCCLLGCLCLARLGRQECVVVALVHEVDTVGVRADDHRDDRLVLVAELLYRFLGARPVGCFVVIGVEHVHHRLHLGR